MPASQPSRSHDDLADIVEDIGISVYDSNKSNMSAKSSERPF